MESFDQFTATSLHVSGNQTSSKPNPCLFCNKDHKPQHCTIVTDVSSRKNIIRDKKRCLFCLRIGHVAKNCTSNIKCHKCSERHHAAVCNKPKSGRPAEKNQTHANVSYSSEPVLLQTAKVEVGTQHLLPARVLFDGGSQLSYITPKLRNLLNLKTLGTQEIQIKTFGSGMSQETLECVKVPVKTLDGSFISVSCYVKDICHPLTSQNTKIAVDSYPHLRNLLLADYNQGEEIGIDLLVGSNFYWNFIGDKVIRGDQNKSRNIVFDYHLKSRMTLYQTVLLVVNSVLKA